MNDFIVYTLKVVAIQGIFFGLFWLFLRRSGRHSINRWYLMCALVLSFTIPVLEFSIPEKAPEMVHENPVITWLSEPAPMEFEIIPVKVEYDFSWWSLLPWCYGLIAVVLVTRSTLYLSVLYKLKKHSEPIKKRWFTLFKTSQNRSFSFFSNVFIPRWLFGTDAFDQILAHECVHVRQLHSMDRLLLDFVVSLFWFNPFIYLYRNALIEIHEYQADEAVIKEFKDPVAYQEILYSQLQSPQYSGMVSHFNFQMIKKRIVMMNKQKKRTGLVYVLAIPVTLLTVFAFSSKDAMEPIDKVGEELYAFVGPINDVTAYAENFFQSDNIPSILPIKEENVTKLTSGFGMRTHPLLKVKKMHRGLDFKCAIGTEIIATADGVVSELKMYTSGYGKLLTIDHGNGFVTRFAQLSEFVAKEGDKVVKGQVVALSGNSGASTGSHLHYEVIKDGEHVDPKDFIKNYSFKTNAAHAKPSREEQATVSEIREKEKELAQRQMELAVLEKDLAEKERKMASMSNEISHEEKLLALEERQKAEQEKLRLAEEKRMLEEVKYGELQESQEYDEFQESDELQEYEEEREGKASIKIEGLGEGPDPLFILDGKEVSRGELEELDNDSIMSLSVLKDEAATEEYGDKGNNGVIVIESKGYKKGNKRKEKIKDKRKSKIKQAINKREKERKISKRLGRLSTGSLNLTNSERKVKKVIIDAGHGGKDEGASSPLGMHEKDVSLSIAKAISENLEGDPLVEVVLTRSEDEFMDLRTRAKGTDEADLFISLHLDNTDEHGRFVSSVYSNKNEFEEQSKKLASLIASEFDKNGKDNKVGYSAGYYVLNEASCPAVLLNVGWFYDDSEGQNLSSVTGQQEVASIISEAIQEAIL